MATYSDWRSALDASLRSVGDALRKAQGRRIRLSRYCVGDGSDESAGLRQAITDALASGGTLDCDVPGIIGCGSTVTLGDERANSLQRSLMTVTGTLRVVATASMDTLLRISGTVTLAGNIEADGASKAFFAVYFKNYGRASVTGRIQAMGGLCSGVAGEPSGNNNAWSIEKLRVHGSGSKLVTTATVTARSAESGWASTGDSAPYTTWSLSSPLPAALASREWAVPAALMADGRVMQVRRVVDASTIEVFNEDRAVGYSESITLASAAIAFPYFGDVGVWTIGNCDVRDNPNAWALNYGGYGGAVTTWAQQNNFGGALILKKATGISFAHFYTEQSGSTAKGTPWLVVRDSTLSTVFVGPGACSEPDNWQAINLAWMSLSGRNVRPLHWQMFRQGGSSITLPPAAPLDPPATQPGTKTITPGTVQAYRHTSGSPTFRIDVTQTAAVGIVQLSTPKLGGGMTLQLGVSSTTPGHTIMGATVSTSTYWTSRKLWGDALVVYYLPAGTTDWQVAIYQAADVATAITAAPAYVGQTAVVSGVVYIAAGTAAAADWKQVS